MYEREEAGAILQEELATIFEIMLGVNEMELSGLFVSLGRTGAREITYGKDLEQSTIKLVVLKMYQLMLACISVSFHKNKAIFSRLM